VDWKSEDWIEHSIFGVGQVTEERGDKIDVHFVDSGQKTLLKSAQLKSALPPTPHFSFPRDKANRRIGPFKVERKLRQPLSFDHLIACFTGYFPEGFEGDGFRLAERDDKTKTAEMLKKELSQIAFDELLASQKYSEICHVAKRIIQETNLAHPIEKAKFTDALKTTANQAPFANALFEILYEPVEMEKRFTNFCNVLSDIGLNSWPVATYYQFIATDGEWMFMKPTVMQIMADSLKISLNYKPEPNWLTYSKLQDLARRVDIELQSRKLKPHSGIDVQGFIWASIKIEAGTY
jgi:hypothetical protein